MNLEKGNKEFLNKLDNNKELKDKRDALVKGQHPDILVITCSDSRVVPEFIFNASLGDIFVTYPVHDESGNPKKCSKLCYVDEANKNGANIKVISLKQMM